MRLHRSRLLASLPLALVAVLAGGCIDDPTAVEEEGAPPLSQEEIEFLGLTPLFHALEAQENVEDSTAVDVAAGRILRPLAMAVPSLAPTTFDESVSTVVPCAEGGDVDVSATLTGFVDGEAGTADLKFTFVMTPELCAVSDDGFAATLFGDPNITVVFEISTEGDGVIDIEGSMTGGIGALTEGRVAECALDVSFTGSESAEAGTTFDIQGEMCGRPVSTSVGSGGTT